MVKILNEKLLYERLKNELEICEIGGLFIALYDNPKVPQLIINLLKNDEDLKNFFQFPLYIDESKISFPALFDYTFQLGGKQTNIFHILGIEENLSSESAQEFLGHLQYSRERFKAKPYSLIFWITPEFEKELFHKATDFHHLVFSTYDFTNINEEEINSLTNSLKQESFDFNKIDEYLQKVIWQYENWQTVKDSQDNFLVEPMARKDLYKYYVKSFCFDQENNKYLLDDFANNFLDNPQQNFLTILADFGTGKSSFLIHYFVILAKKYLVSRSSFTSIQQRSPLAPLKKEGNLQRSTSVQKGENNIQVPFFKRNLEGSNISFQEEENNIQVPFSKGDLGGSRIPIFISLKDYRGKLNIEDFMVQEFYEKFNIELDYGVFQELALEGKFIFLIDGFDEMASLTDKELTIENLKELTKLSFENILFLTKTHNPPPPVNKIILTSRTHYFLTESQEQKILKADQTILDRNYATKSTYQLTRVKLEEFNDAQIKEFIQKHTENEAKTAEYLKIIEDTYNLQDLSTRPLLLNMIIATIPTLKKKDKINSADIYGEYTNIWIERDDWRSQMTPEGKRVFMWDMAIKMFREGGDFSLHYSQLDKPKSEYLKQDYQADEDYYKYEVTTCTFLNRNAERNYKFIHKSFMEYFVAESFYFHLRKNNTRIIKYSSLNKEMKFFLKYIISLNKQQLNDLDLSSFDLSQIDLSHANLWNTNLSQANLSQANLSDANLIKANLSDANLWNTDLSQANLSNADLSQANLIKANLRYADLKYADLKYVNLRYADLKYANLRYANLSQANLIKANLSQANLRYADLKYADLKYANLKYANLKYANLKYANLKYANLWKANLSRSYLSNVNLSYANLSYAILSQIELSKTNLYKANLAKAINLTCSQIKLACFWEEAIYREKGDKNQNKWVIDYEANQKYIEEIRQDKSSDPQQKPDCSQWR